MGSALSGDAEVGIEVLDVGFLDPGRNLIFVGFCNLVVQGNLRHTVANLLQGDLAGAYAIHRQFYPLFRDLFVESNPIPIKAAMAELKMLCEEYRLPMCEMEPANRAKLIASMKRCGLLK